MGDIVTNHSWNQTCGTNANSEMSIFGLTLLLSVLLFFATAVQAQSFSVIHNFSGNSDGSYPFTGLTIDSAGHLYGTTYSGGSGHRGTVFSMNTSGAGFTTLYGFSGGSDGAGPMAKLALRADGSIWGSTSAGGGGSCTLSNGDRGCGTIFKVSPPRGPGSAGFSWSTAILYRFSGTNGSYPQGELTFDSSGNIYGTAVNGGTYGWGLVFSLTPSGGSWVEDILYQARNDGDGQYPMGGVIFDHSGNLYGIMPGGGRYNFGVVYQLARSGSGWQESTVHNFQFQGDDGAQPNGGLISDTAGNIYGTTVHLPGAGGSAFELSSEGGGWNDDFVSTFSGGINLGPYDKLVMDSSGDLYGTTFADGRYGFGSVFKLTRVGGGWSYHSLHDFTGGQDGGNPMSALVFDASGNIYGTASAGGQYHKGVVFKIVP